MQLTPELVNRLFGVRASFRAHLNGGCTITTESGGKIVVIKREIRCVIGSAEDYGDSAGRGTAAAKRRRQEAPETPRRQHSRCAGAPAQHAPDNMLRPALSMVHEIAPDRVVVRGKAELLLMAVNEAKAMDINVIPESDMEMFVAVTSNVVVVLCTVLAFQWVNLWQAMAIGFVSGCSLCIVALRLFWRQFRDRARRKGLEIVKYDMGKAVRKATIEEARKRGML